jgi:uncharacterized protein YecE (DUF72 family)
MAPPRETSNASEILIGTAGWSIPRAAAHRFEAEGTHLQRYSASLRCAEINSSFYRSHSEATYARWARSTPDAFRFAVKLPREISHERRLVDCGPALDRFLRESEALGPKRGALLLQLPPSLPCEIEVARRFLGYLRRRYEGLLVCEPRNPSWFSPGVEALLVGHEVARVAADPPPVPGAERPGGWGRAVYYRLHGSPRKYWSPYDGATLTSLADALREASAGSAWCVFDNTASGAALDNAWSLAELTGSLQGSFGASQRER